MTQHELARATRMPQSSLARIESGTVVPRSATLIEILRATGHRLSVEPIDLAVDRDAVRRRLAMSVPRRTRPAPAKGERILQRLRRYAVPFVLIGELAEAAHGSTVKPGGVIEICVASTDVARERLSLALGDRGPKNLRILTETPAGDDYDVLVRNTIAMHVEPGILVRVAALEDLIRSRRARRTPKDSEAARVLSAILEESPPG